VSGIGSQKTGKRDRFYLLANVLWSKHLLRHAASYDDEKEREINLMEALEKATLAYKGFRLNCDKTHPDTRLAARAKRRLELKLDPFLVTKWRKSRSELDIYIREMKGQETYRERSGSNTIRVMQWNVLADKLAYPDFKKGGFGCKFEILDWDETRKERVLAEICKWAPDIIVLVELDHYEDIRIVLQEDYGYDSVWKKKNKNFYTDGTGIFWKKERFKSTKIYKKPLKKKLDSPNSADQVFVAIQLSPQDNESFAPFVVAGCHLKSTKASPGEVIRLDQCKQIMNILKSEFQGLPVILGADMNAEHKASSYEAKAYPYMTNDCGMISAYKNVLGKEPLFTSWKFRLDEDNSLNNKGKVKEWKYTIDFIFHSDSVKSLAALEMPEEREIDKVYGGKMDPDENMFDFARRRCLLPNERCPSDHLPLLADIELP